MSLFSISLILFLIIDPIGNVSIYHNLLEGYSKKQRLWVVMREMLFALVAMMIFYLLGEYVLSFLSITPTALQLSSGVILLIAAIKILFPGMGEFRAIYRSHKEPYIIPLAIPLVAGPSLLATIMLFSQFEGVSFYILPAILFAWLASLLILLNAPVIHRAIGDNGLGAAERVMGMVLVLLAIQRFLEGMNLFIASLPSS